MLEGGNSYEIVDGGVDHYISTRKEVLVGFPEVGFKRSGDEVKMFESITNASAGAYEPDVTVAQIRVDSRAAR